MPRVERTGNVAPGIREVIREFGESFASFFRKRHILVALAFMILYKFPEAQIIKMINPFLLHPESRGGLGLTTAEVGVKRSYHVRIYQSKCE